MKILIIAVVVICALPVIFKIILSIQTACHDLRHKYEQERFKRAYKKARKETDVQASEFMREEMAKEHSTWFTPKNDNNVNVNNDQNLQIGPDNKEIPYLPPAK